MQIQEDPMAKVLVVDDDVLNLKVLDSLLKAAGHEAVLAASGHAALQSVAQDPPDLILLDVMMPGIDGFEVASALKQQDSSKNIPIIMVTALDGRASRLHALEAGAEDFLTKPIDRIELTMRVRNLLKLKAYSDLLTNYNQVLEARVAERTSQLASSHRETIFTMTRAAEYKDEETGAHVRRISYYTVELATRLALDAQFCDTIHYASPMHDIGKIGIPDHILGKPGSFTPDEWQVMKTHALLGARLLAGATSPYLQMGEQIALGHHERWDGSGYPGGLQGEQIPLSARLMNLCDQYDALRSKRPYKPAFTHQRACEIITAGDGRTMPGHFDPAVLAAFTHCTGVFNDIYEQHSDAEPSPASNG
jgi:putative two-component system response regulator